VDNEWEEMWVGVPELVVLSSEFLSVTGRQRVTPGYLLFPTEFEPDNKLEALALEPANS